MRNLVLALLLLPLPAMAGLLIWVLMRSKRLATELRAKGLSDPGSKTES